MRPFLFNKYRLDDCYGPKADAQTIETSECPVIKRI